MANKNKDLLTLGHWNANGLTEKWTELKNFIFAHNIDVMLVNETKLTKKKLSSIPGYIVIRQDRPGNTAGGGLLIIIKNTINYQETNKTNLSTIEALGIKINYIIVYSVYIRPTIDNKLNKINKQELGQLINSSTSVILMGDFNSKHTFWNCKANNYNGKLIYEYVNQNNLTVKAPDNFTLYPTIGGLPSTVDFAIFKNIQFNSKIDTINELDSDHLPVLLNLELQQNITKTRTPKLNYKN